MINRFFSRFRVSCGLATLGFATLLVAVVAAGCGGGSSSSTPTTPTTPTTPASPTGPSLSLSAALLTFASVTSDPQNVVLTNNGTDLVTINSIVATGNFTATDNCNGSVDVGAACTVTVSFVPLAPGSQGVLTINDNTSANPHTISLTGPMLTPPTAMLAPQTLTFAGRAVGTTSSPQVITLTNPVNGQAAPLTITNIVPVGDFAIAQTTCGKLLPVGSSCAVSVTFTPTDLGPRTGLIAFFDNAPTLQQGVTLNGTGQ